MTLYMYYVAESKEDQRLLIDIIETDSKKKKKKRGLELNCTKKVAMVVSQEKCDLKSTSTCIRLNSSEEINSNTWVL